MEQNPIFEAAQELVRKGDTSQALQVLIAALERDKRYPELLKSLKVIEANYNAARQKELKGLLAFSDAQLTYNQTNDALLSVLTDLLAGRQPILAQSPGVTNGQASGGSRIWILGGALILLLGVVLGLWWRSRHKQDNAATAASVEKQLECPQFAATGSRVLLLPFSSFAAADSKPELLIKARITEIARNNDFPVSVEILSAYDTKGDLPDDNDVKPLGERCDADLVVWGLYGKGERDSFQIETRYLFVGEEGRSGGTRFQSLPSITSVRSGKMFKSIDDVVFSLCTRMAYRMDRPALALKWLKKMKDLDPDERKLLELLEKKMEKEAKKEDRRSAN